MIVGTFDLESVRAIQNRGLRVGRGLAAGGAVLIGSIDVLVVITNHGLSLGAPLLLVQMGVSFGLVAFLIWAALFFLGAGPGRMILTSEGMVFESAGGKRRVYRWDDPSLDLSLRDFTGIRATRSWSRPLYPFMLSGQGFAAYNPICLSVEAGTAILQEAKAHNLCLSERGPRGPLATGSLSPHETRIQGPAAASRYPSSTSVPT